ncbi:NUDIX hydrolase [Thermus igniterrae]|uniref:NUDIX hydrolase n=1 Tax=Thermus igniterrae TaxID=88189 RepID=UPI000381AA98|nr:NUDIX hydrolase [Thermus igniterrae]
MSPWERLFIEEILTEPVRLVRERVRTHTGKELTYIYRPGPVAASFVLPVTERATALLIRQYRHPTGKFLLEIPAGKVDAGESPEAAARRELLEEVGAVAGEVVALPPFHPQPSFTAVVFHPFLALKARVVGAPSLEDGELLEPLEVPLTELYTLLERGQVEDASTALTLFYARPHLEKRGLL